VARWLEFLSLIALDFSYPRLTDPGDSIPQAPAGRYPGWLGLGKGSAAISSHEVKQGGLWAVQNLSRTGWHRHSAGATSPKWQGVHP
jgi:hypothetical protein